MRGLHFSTEREAGAGPWWLWMLAGLLGAALGWCVAGFTVMKAGGYEPGFWPQAWRYADTGRPMISSADGFYFMHWARVALDYGYAGIPPFSRLTAMAARLTSQPVEAVAFYMSLAFHLGLGLLAAAWGRRLRAGLFCVFPACLAVALMPAWLERAGPGRFDTDLPILFFWQAGLYFLARATRAGHESSDDWRPLNLAPALVSFALLSWLWLSSGLALALVSLAVWAFLFLPFCRFWGFKARALAGLIMAAWLASLVLLPPDKAPAPDMLLEVIHTKMTLAFGIRPELFYISIKELAPLSPGDLLEKVGGSVYGGVALLLVGLLAFIRRPALRLPLFLGFIAILIGLKANRVVYLGLFPLALAAGFLPSILADLRCTRLPGRPAWAAGFMVTAVILYSCLQWASHRDLDLRWEGGHDRLLEVLRREPGNGARLWNWWDDGYFLAARLPGAKPLFDGGSQTHTMAYIAARPFMMDDRRAAARWMRFFAIRGEAGLAPLIKIWGPDQAWIKLEELLAAETREAAALDLAKLPGGAEWLFPPGTVYWYMPGYFSKTSNWWIPLGLSRQPDRKLVRPHMEKIGRDQFRYDPGTRALTITQSLWDRGYTKIGRIFNVDERPLSPPWPSGGAPYIAYSDKKRNSYIVDEWGIRTLPLHMMLTGGTGVPGFRPLAADEEFGGVWEIMPL